MNRRSLLKGLGITAAAGTLPSLTNSQTKNADDKVTITKVESVRFSDKIKIGGGSGGSGETEFCWVRLHTSNGIIGTGETYPFTNGELGALRDYTQLLIGSDPRNIEELWKKMYHDMSMRNARGADMRIISAINRPKRPVASQRAKPISRLVNWPGAADGLRRAPDR